MLNGRTEVEKVLFGQFGNLCHDTPELLNLLMKKTDFVGFREESHLFDTTAPQCTQTMVAEQLTYFRKAYFLLEMLWVYHTSDSYRFLAG